MCTSCSTFPTATHPHPPGGSCVLQPPRGPPTPSTAAGTRSRSRAPCAPTPGLTALPWRGVPTEPAAAPTPGGQRARSRRRQFQVPHPVRLSGWLAGKPPAGKFSKQKHPGHGDGATGAPPLQCPSAATRLLPATKPQGEQKTGSRAERSPSPWAPAPGRC